MKLFEIKKPKQVEPSLPAAKPEDIQAVHEAVGFLFAVQKRLEQMDADYKDTFGYGGIGIYSHYISFRMFTDGSIPTNDKRAIRQIVAEELRKRPQLKRFLANKVEMPIGEGEINVPWLAGYWSDEWQAAWAAAGMQHVDHADMVAALKWDVSEGAMNTVRLGYGDPVLESVFDNPPSAPLIWRAVKYANDKGQTVWSKIKGATGIWTIRDSDDYKPGNQRLAFYVRCRGYDGMSDWFEIMEADDDTLAIQPDDDGGWEVFDQGGKFTIS